MTDPNDLLDVVDHLGGGVADRGQAVHDLALQLLLQPRDNLCGLAGVEVGKNERGGLGVFAPQEAGQLVRLDRLQEVERRHLHRRLHPHHDLFGPAVAQGLVEHLAGVFHTALRYVVLSARHVPVLQEHLLHQLAGGVAHAGHLHGHLFHLLVVEVLEDVAGRFHAEGDEERGGLLGPGEVLRVVGEGSARGPLRARAHGTAPLPAHPRRVRGGHWLVGKRRSRRSHGL